MQDTLKHKKKMKIIIKTQKNWVIAITSGKFKSNKNKERENKVELRSRLLNWSDKIQDVNSLWNNQQYHWFMQFIFDLYSLF